MRRRGVIRRAWKCRWGIVRLAVALFLLWTLAADGAARAARAGLRLLPDHDFVMDVRGLREAGRFGEAIATADGALAIIEDDPAANVQRALLKTEREIAVNQQRGWLRKARDVGAGVISGASSEYVTLERLAGAIAADFFIFGDVRDLVVESVNAFRGDEVDELIVALSAVGVGTTFAPYADWAPSVLKAARRARALSKAVSEFLVQAAKAHDVGAIRRVLGDIRVLSRNASPAGAVRLMRHADTPSELAAMAKFVERTGPKGAVAIGSGGARTVDVIADASGSAARAAHAEAVLMRAARKGPGMERWLNSLSPRALRALSRPHFLIGITKGIYKGNVSRGIARLLESADIDAWWIMGVLACWCVLEGGLIWMRLAESGRDAEVRVVAREVAVDRGRTPPAAPAEPPRERAAARHR